MRPRRGVLSTGFLWLVDVPRARAQCEAFVQAEAKAKAFGQEREALDRH
jgi:hypothetical protein